MVVVENEDYQASGRATYTLQALWRARWLIDPSLLHITEANTVSQVSIEGRLWMSLFGPGFGMSGAAACRRAVW